MNIKGLLVKSWEKTRQSYWFVPSLMTIAAVILSFAFINLDEWAGAKWLGQWEFLYANKPEGARALLSTIAGSMIGVAGVTFSITIAAVAYASSSFGPRIINNFMKDTGNQVTLGTFISTYVYCLLILRTVRNGDESSFVPHLSVLFGVVLALASLCVLIFFIHHIPESIHVANVVSGIGKEMLAKAETMYPDKLRNAKSSTEKVARRPPDPDDYKVVSERTGYLQSVDAGLLMEIASENDLVLVMNLEPGMFTTVSRTLVRVHGENAKDQESAIRGCFIFGSDRSPTQDLLYLIDQLIDIAGRALSPGINDPFTAISCVNWLNALLTQLADREFPAAHLEDEGGKIRVINYDVSYERYVDSIWDRLRPYVEKDRNASLHMLDSGLQTLDGLNAHRRLSLALAMNRLVEGCLRHFDHSKDFADLEERRQCLKNLTGSDAQLRAESIASKQLDELSSS